MVILSWCLAVCSSDMFRYCSKTRHDRNFRFAPYYSLESLVFCDKISCHWVNGVPTNEEAREERCYFATIGLFSVKMVADRHRHAAYHKKSW